MASINRRKKRLNGTLRRYWLILLLSVFLFFLYVIFSKSFWNGEDKLNIVVNSKDGYVSVISVDPEFAGMTLLDIPDSVEVALTRNLGEMRLASVWQLGLNEGYKGALLAEVITKNFQIPVSLWGDNELLGFWTGEPVAILKAVFTNYKTNLTLSDKLKLAVFSLKVKNFKKVKINLADTGFLKAKKLVDGEGGYVVFGLMPKNILAIFSDSRLTKNPLKVEIIDASSFDGVARDMGKIIEVMGAKVALIRKVPKENMDCEIFGKTTKFIEAVGPVFSCQTKKDLNDGGFDLVIKIGEKFAERF